MTPKVKSKKKNNSPKLADIISDKVGNYEKHPFFVKKTNAAKEFLKKSGLPGDPVKAK